MQLLSLGEPGVAGSALEGIRLDAPYFAVTTIPERAYGTQPESAVGTISVRALLVARADVPEDLVFGLTRALFDHKVELSSENRLLAHLSEHVDLATSPYAVHPGADRYYRRDEPTLLQRYTDQISLMITVGALIWSALSAFAAARRQSRRNRIEHRYGDAQALAAKARTATEPSDLHALHAQLIEMRENVIAELANERLDANDAFVILQHYLTAQIAELERRIDRAERAIGASP